MNRPARLASYCAAGALSVCAAAGAPAATMKAEAAPEVHPQQWPKLHPPLARDPLLEARIEQLRARLTAEQQVGQLIQADIGSITPDDLRHYPLGSILNGGNSAPHDDKLAAPSEWLSLADRFYDAALGATGQGVPPLWGTDAVHGHNAIAGATLFPHNIGLGAARDPQLIRRIGEITALEVRVTGLDWAFAPTVAVARDARWGRTYESYGENPELVRQYAAAMVRGLQGTPGTPQFLDAAHVLATPKHFLGDGGTEDGHDQGNNDAPESELRDIDAAGYEAAVSAGAQTIMVSYSSWRGSRMHGNHALLTEVLKGRMGFDGLLLGDWNGHAQLPGCTAVRCAAAIEAGVDVLMAPDGWRELHANLLSQLRGGEISAARVEDAVRRVLRVKLRAHLDSEGRPSSRPFAGHYELLGAPAHREVARQAVRESLVLLKNRAHLLPLSPRARVLVAGDAADSIARQSGGWTIDWQGTEPNQDFPHGETVFAGIDRCVRAAGGTATLSADGQFTTRPQVAIVVFGEHPYAEYQGDVMTLEYSPGDKHDLALLRRLRAQGIPVVAVLLSGRPLWVNAELNASDSFIAAWLPGPEGGALADVLFRSADGKTRYDFRGRLSFSWPRSPRPPGVTGRPSEPPLFPYGYGLTYAADREVPELPETAAPAPSRPWP
ncbi:MAG TPA: glycoside hydrolase family 3 protein [Steroidobacteraceae bacterium]|nr:glycoside hydrolase family 3 protein [Steroidobacteraceae bacterium]